MPSRQTLSRRHLVGAAALAPLTASAATSAPTIRKPKALKPGDTIGVIAPSSASWEQEQVKVGLEVAESLGFRIKPGQHISDIMGDLAGEDQARADDVNALFADPEVDGIIALRGGYGAQRILPYLDYETIGHNPKALVGFSDITALHLAIHAKTGMVTFHGPNLMSKFTEYTYESFAKVLLEPRKRTLVAQPPPFVTGAPGQVERENRLVTIARGKARGRLVGGNLTILTTLMGTPYQPDFAGRILFLEDVQEAPYRIDRMLTQLWLAGAFERVAGVALGKFTEALPGRGRNRSVEEILRQRFEGGEIPVLQGLMIGHISDHSTLPIGIEAELDADAGTLTLLEPAVSA